MFKRHSPTGRSVLVSLRSGNAAISGICTWQNRDAILLRGVTVHSQDAEPAPADGEVLIDRSNVDYIQLL